MALLTGAALGETFAQSAPPDLPSFSPFVSNLAVEARNNMVRLSWADSADVRGPVYVFRSSRPFFEAVPPDLTPVEIPYGTGFHIDEIDGSGTFYYFVAASDLLGRRHDMILHEINTVRVSASGETAPFARTSAVEPLPGLGISGILARPDGEAVIITYKTPPGLNNLILYRSLHPLRRPEDLLNAVIVQSGLSSPFADYPVPGLSWYYAVISEEEITGGSVGIYPGRNATQEAVAIAGEETPVTARSVRSMPLPAMSLHNAAPDSDYFSRIPETVPLNGETVKALETVRAAPAVPPPEKKPRAFARDLEEPAGGEDSALMRIVQGSFIKRDWRTAHDELQRYLALPHSAATEARARFYLGQTCYFSGKYREALVEFLFAQSLHPAETHVWIEATLAALVR